MCVTIQHDVFLLRLQAILATLLLSHAKMKRQIACATARKEIIPAPSPGSATMIHDTLEYLLVEVCVQFETPVPPFIPFAAGKRTRSATAVPTTASTNTCTTAIAGACTATIIAVTCTATTAVGTHSSSSSSSSSSSNNNNNNKRTHSNSTKNNSHSIRYRSFLKTMQTNKRVQ